jgi:hypothetical protein
MTNVSTEQLEDPTPCASWAVRDLVNHIVGGTAFFAKTVETGTGPTSDGAQDFASSDIIAAFDEGAKRAIAAFAAEGAMERVVNAPMGEVPGSIFVWIASVDLDPALASQLLDVSKLALTDDFRGPDKKALFGYAVEVPDDAPCADRLAGFLGRQD